MAAVESLAAALVGMPGRIRRPARAWRVDRPSSSNSEPAGAPTKNHSRWWRRRKCLERAQARHWRRSCPDPVAHSQPKAGPALTPGKGDPRRQPDFSCGAYVCGILNGVSRLRRRHCWTCPVSSRLWITHRLRQDDRLFRPQLQFRPQCLSIHRGPGSCG